MNDMIEFLDEEREETLIQAGTDSNFSRTGLRFFFSIFLFFFSFKDDVKRVRY